MDDFFLGFLKSVDTGIFDLVNNRKKEFFDKLSKISVSTDKQKEIDLIKASFQEIAAIAEQKISETNSPILWMDFAFWNLFLGNYDRLDFLISIKNRNFDFPVKDTVRQFYTNNPDFFVELQSQLIYPLETKAYTFVFDWESDLSDYDPAPGSNNEIVVNLGRLQGFSLTDLVNDFQRNPGNYNLLREKFASTVLSFTKSHPDLASYLDKCFSSIKEQYNYSLAKKQSQKFNLAEFIKIIFLNRLTEDKWRFLYIIPSKLFKEIGGGGCFVAADRKLDSNELFLLQEVVNKISSTFSIAFNWEYKEENLKKAYLKSAMAAIMARNISHNLGSHVLSYVKADLSSTERIVHEGVLDNMLDENLTLFQGTTESETQTQKFNELKKRIAGITKDHGGKHPASYLLGLGHLLNYVQERQDYIATIASATIPYFSTINFKDHILDEFTHDAKSKRHSKSQELQQNLLLKYIALSEQKTRHFLNAKTRGENNIEFTLTFVDAGGQRVSFETYNPGDKVIESELRNINIEVPAGILGRQAFFSILENIIRNAAKHGAVQGTLAFEIVVEEFSDFFYNIKIFTNEEGDLKRKAQKLNSLLNADLVNKDGSIEESNKGLKEIYISAAWLKNVIFPDIKDSTDEIIRVFEEKGRLGYQFKLFKSRKVAIVVRNEEQKQALAIFTESFSGWQIFTLNEFLRNKFSYRLYIIDSGLNYAINDIDARYPSRKIFTDLNKDLFSGAMPENLYQTWYEEYLSSRYGELPVVIISDTPARDTNEPGIIVCESGEWLKKLDETTLPVLLFKKHLNEENDYEKFNKIYQESGLANKVRFVESITGNNSTDRLLRHEILDKEWWLKMVESSLTKVLIIDERLWQKITNAQITSLNKEFLNTQIAGVLTELIPDLQKIEKLNSLYSFPREILTQAIYGNQHEKLKDYIRDFGDGINEVYVQYHFEHDLHRLHNLQIATFLLDNTDKKYKMYGLPTVSGNVKDAYEVSIDPTGVPDIKNPAFDCCYDFVLIHQGILDKFGISHNDPGQSSAKALFEVIKSLFKANGNSEKKPVFIIHSGRSKPPVDSYPDPSVPFIQYSSVESSFNDCKYTLTELLYSAINTN